MIRLYYCAEHNHIEEFLIKDEDFPADIKGFSFTQGFHHYEYIGTL